MSIYPFEKDWLWNVVNNCKAKLDLDNLGGLLAHQSYIFYTNTLSLRQNNKIYMHEFYFLVNDSTLYYIHKCAFLSQSCAAILLRICHDKSVK